MGMASWLLLLLSILFWAGIIVSCFPSSWPSFIHELLDGHRKVTASTLQTLEVVTADQRVLLLADPLRSRLVAAYNEAVFMQKRPVALLGETCLRFTLENGWQILVLLAKREGDIYIYRLRKGKVRAAYWARQPELHDYLAHRLWQQRAKTKWTGKDRTKRWVHLHRVQ